MYSMPAEVACSDLDAAPDAMIIIDSAGVACFASRQSTAIFGYARIEHRRGYWNGVRPMSMGLELCARRQDGTEILDMRPPLGPLGKPRVLLVEDDPAVRDATRLLLRVEGYEVKVAASLAEALGVAKDAKDEQTIDVVIADYHLGSGETGIQVIERIRERLGRRLGAVLMTGDTCGAIRDLPRGPNLRVISKPTRADELLTLLRELGFHPPYGGIEPRLLAPSSSKC